MGFRERVQPLQPRPARLGEFSPAGSSPGKGRAGEPPPPAAAAAPAEGRGRLCLLFPTLPSGKPDPTLARSAEKKKKNRVREASLGADLFFLTVPNCMGF